MKKNAGIVVIVIASVIIFLLQFQYKKTYHPHTYYRVYLDDKIIGTIESKEQLEDYINKQGTLIKNQILDYKEQLEILNGLDSIISKKLSNNSDKKTYFNMKDAYDSLSKIVDDKGTFDSKDREKVEEYLEILEIEDAFLSSNSIRNYSAIKEKISANFMSAKEDIIDFIKENNISLSETEQYQLDTYISKELDTVSYIKQNYMQNYVEANAVYEYTNNVYSPLGLNVEKINTYYASLSEVDELYQNIIKEKPCTVEGYQFRIKKTEEKLLPSTVSTGALLLEDSEFLFNKETDDVIIYVTDEKVFTDAVEKLEIVFVGADEFEKYQKETQSEIVDTGTKINDVYVEENITVKRTNISVGEKIYNDADELSSFLLYGAEEKSEKIVYATPEDDVLSLARKNGISIEELFLSNPTITSINNIFYNNQPIVIAQTNPQISIVVEQFTVTEEKIKYSREEKYDSRMNIGTEYIDQVGKDGLERVSRNVKKINGQISFVQPVSNITLKQPQNEIVLIGTKSIPSVGSLKSWYWPTNSGYVLTSYFGWRKNPFGSNRELHTGLDIAGTGYGSPVYAANNGTIISIKSEKWSYGNSIIIDHGNGYYSLYAHMSGFAKGLKEGTVVSRGQTIGYIGSTGAATGPHLHFEIRDCPGYGCVMDPLPFLRK